MRWNFINDLYVLESIDRVSEQVAVLVFKHSTRCSISSTALARLERQVDMDLHEKAYFLDLLNHRDLSQEIAQKYQVKHESPQVLVIKNKQAVYHASHLDIRWDDIKKFFA